MSRSKPPPTKCEFKDGRRRCHRNGHGEPALCDQHRRALEGLGYQMPRPGIGEQLGGIFDQIVSGVAPKSIQFEQIAADIAGSLLGRTVTIEEVRRTRSGDYSQIHAYLEALRARAAQAQQRAQPQAPFDPTIAARIEYMKSLGRARAVLGFTKDDALTPELIKDRYRKLARQHHPDREGGSTEKMQKINAAADLLSKSLETQ